MNAGRRLRILRRMRGWTQAELAEGIASIAHVSNMENGKCEISDYYIAKFASKLGVTPDFLRGNDPPHLTQEYDEVIPEFNEALNLYNLQTADAHRPRVEALAEQLADIDKKVNAYRLLTTYHIRKRNLQEAKTWLEKMEGWADEGTSLYTKMLITRTKGTYAFYRGEYITAYNRFCEALALAQHLPIDVEVAYVYYNIASALDRMKKDNREILYYWTKFYEIAHMLGRWYEMGIAQLVLSVVHMRYNDLLSCETCLRTAKQILSRFENPYLQGYLLYNMGSLSIKKKLYEQGVSKYKQAIEILQQNGYEIDSVRVYLALCRHYSHISDFTNLKKYTEEGVRLAARLNIPLEKNDLLVYLAEAERASGNHEHALELLQEALTFYEQNQYTNQAARTAEKIGDLFHSKRKYKEAAKYYKIATKLQKGGEPA
ncbi:MAG TPA: helix-turn-helix domain-containing protein [Calditerricola sp.]